MQKLWECMELEQNFTYIKRSKPAYFNYEEVVIKESEDQLCQAIASHSKYNVTVELCKQIENEVLVKGMSLVH
jgi:hypothetical protein